MVRYRLPCTLANSTFFVTVSVEHCSNPWEDEDDIPRANPPRVPGIVPKVEMEFPAVEMMRPLHDPGASLREPVGDSGAGPSDSGAGPSNRGARDRSKAILQPPRCKAEDEPQTTDED